MAEKITLHNGDSAEVLKQYPDNHFDSIVTDPPYGIEFLGKEWDKNTGAIEVWKECLRVLKPGGHILAFSAARTYHRLATNLEDIGFEIRDQIMWIYGSGFPKGQDMGKLIAKREGQDLQESRDFRKEEGDSRTVSNGGSPKCPKCPKCNSTTGITSRSCDKEGCPQPWISPKLNEWSGWKTGLKPAHEPIVMARKPFKGSTVDNVIEYGVGAINIDDTRVVPQDGDPYNDLVDHYVEGKTFSIMNENGASRPKRIVKSELGRYPSNVIMSEEEGEQEYKKYFYCPKVRRKERNIGCMDLEIKELNRATSTQGSQYCKICNKTFNGTNDHTQCGGEKNMTSHGKLEFYVKNNPVYNNHPTVKPVALMKYLVTLITPPGGKVLDPFNGSGSTGMAVKEFGGEYVGIDLNPDYIEISQKRIKAW